ncbi:GPI biosynthesis protein Pig-F [Xylogone sp. PMI_703]|nr:GPI biosynthesis protein Pig-F [Xylogone sp. PMI_703]
MSTPKPVEVSSALSKPSTPTELLPTELARVFTHIHPALLLGAYYLRFPALVADPVSALLYSILPLAIIQIVYVLVCLPVAGSTTKPVKKPKPGAKKTSDDSSAATKPLTVFFALVLSFASVPVLTAVQILFGAPITSHIPHTFLSSAHIALLTIFPLLYTHGADGAKWREIASFYSPLDEVFGGAVGCLVGAWFGAVPIPLDWDREWQKWPVTIVTGAYGGYVVGKFVGGLVLKGKRIEFE